MSTETSTYTLKATNDRGDTLKMDGLTEATKDRYAAQLRDVGIEPAITPEAASYDDRFAEALAWLAVRYEERGEFLSDSDILDAADKFTTSVRGAATDPEPWTLPDNGADHDRLVEDLDIACTPEEDR